MTAEREYTADRVVSDLDPDRLESLLDPGKERAKERLSCSGVAVYATLHEGVASRGRDAQRRAAFRPRRAVRSLEAGGEPRETMAFVNYYRGGEIYPNEGGTLAVLLTAPANGREYGLEDPFVRREIERVSDAAGLREPATRYFGGVRGPRPRVLRRLGERGRGLYGAVRPFWRSGPLHRPPLQRAQASVAVAGRGSVHPGGGIPAVLGGAMISTGRMLRSLVK